MEHYKTNIPLPTKKQMAQQKGIKHTMGSNDDFHKVVCVCVCVCVCDYINFQNYLFRGKVLYQRNTMLHL